MGTETSPIQIRHLTGDQFAVGIRGHELVVDQPAGSDPGVGPTPTELFVAGLGACVGFYAERYLRRHDLPLEGLAVSVDYEIGERPARVTSMNIRLALPAGVPPERVPGADGGRLALHRAQQPGTPAGDHDQGGDAGGRRGVTTGSGRHTRIGSGAVAAVCRRVFGRARSLPEETPAFPAAEHEQDAGVEHDRQHAVGQQEDGENDVDDGEHHHGPLRVHVAVEQAPSQPRQDRREQQIQNRVEDPVPVGVVGDRPTDSIGTRGRDDERDALDRVEQGRQVHQPPRHGHGTGTLPSRDRHQSLLLAAGRLCRRGAGVARY